MAQEGGTAPPQVIRRGEKLVLLNVDLEPLSHHDRVLLALEIFDQVKHLMTLNGERVIQGDVAEVAALLTGAPPSTTNTLKEILNKRPELIALWKGGSQISDMKRAAGRRVRVRVDEGRKPRHKTLGNFGTGDKFDPLAELMLRYLRTWNKRDFEYRHVNPSAAKRRVRKIEEMQSLLAKAKADLEPRSHVATYRAPHERRRENH